MTDSKTNFRSMYQEDLTCNLCDDDALQSDSHLLECSKIVGMSSQLRDNISSKYDDIFSKDVIKQLRVTQLYSEVFKAKTSLDTK